MPTLRTTAGPAAPPATPRPLRPRALRAAALACLLLAGANGCAASSWFSTWHVKRAPAAPPGPVDSMSLGGGGTTADAAPAPGTPAADLLGAKRLYQEGQYAKAAPLFGGISKNKESTSLIAEEALFYQADCERMQGRYPSAAEFYNLLLSTYPMGKHSQPARKHLFDIANYWLDETRAYMEACREKKEGKRKWVSPVSLVHFEKTKPWFDTEGHAVRMLEQVYITDPQGELAEKALFYLGSVKFFREDYREADHYFNELVKFHPSGKLSPEAMRYSIICKQLSTGGSEYDGKLLSEALDKLHVAQASYPELTRDHGEFIKRQLFSIEQQQADGEFKVAEFYRRTGRPGSAYFYYELVRRRYHGTEYARKATERMTELKQAVDKEKAKEKAPPPQSGLGGGGGAPLEVAPVPRSLTPGMPLTAPETGPAPRTLPPSFSNDLRGP